MAGVEFLNKLVSMHIGGGFPDIVCIVIVVPLNQIMNGLFHFFGVKNAFNFKYFLAINDFWLGNQVFEYRTMVDARTLCTYHAEHLDPT